MGIEVMKGTFEFLLVMRKVTYNLVFRFKGLFSTKYKVKFFWKRNSSLLNNCSKILLILKPKVFLNLKTLSFKERTYKTHEILH